MQFYFLLDTDDIESRCSKARSYVIALKSSNSNFGTLRWYFSLFVIFFLHMWTKQKEKDYIK